MFDTWDPNFLALIAAFFVAVARTLYRAGVARLSPMVTNTVMSLVAVLTGISFYWLEGGLERWPLAGVLWFMAGGVVGGFTGRYFSLVSLNLVGLARTSLVMQTSLAWSATLAVLFLGERATIPVVLGTLAIMLGAALLAYEGGNVRRSIPLRYYLVPLITSVTFSFAQLSGKLGMKALGSAPFGMATSNLTSFVLMLSVLSFSSERNPRGWSRSGLLTVSLGAVFNSLAAYFFWSAIKGGELVRVVPINRLSVLLIIFFSWLFFRKQETVNLRVVLGGLLSVAGAFAIAWGK